jgi:hypothetical protein
MARSSDLGLENILRDVHDPVTQTLRTNATATVSGGIVEVLISHLDDSIRIGDGTNLATVTSIGGKKGLDTNIIGTVSTVTTPAGTFRNSYNESNSIASGITTTIVSYTVPSGKTAYLTKIDCSGTNMSEYEIFVNGSLINKKRTYIGSDLNTSFEWSSTDSFGYSLNTGDIVLVKGSHNRPFIGDFNASIMLLEV